MQMRIAAVDLVTNTCFPALPADVPFFDGAKDALFSALGTDPVAV